MRYNFLCLSFGKCADELDEHNKIEIMDWVYLWQTENMTLKTQKKRIEKRDEDPLNDIMRYKKRFWSLY